MEVEVLQLIERGGAVVLLGAVILFGILPIGIGLLRQIGTLNLKQQEVLDCARNVRRALEEDCQLSRDVHSQLGTLVEQTKRLTTVMHFVYKSRGNGGDEQSMKERYRLAADILLPVIDQEMEKRSTDEKNRGNDT